MKSTNRFASLPTALLGLLLTTTFAPAAGLKFEAVPNFFEAGPEKNLGPCHGGAVIDQAGQIYVTTDTKRGIDVFSAAGKYLRSFGPTRIHALELRFEGGVYHLYVARPSEHEVAKLKLDGERVWTLNYPVESGLY